MGFMHMEEITHRITSYNVCYTKLLRDTHEFTGKGSSFLLESKIATMLGIPEHKKAQIYMEVEKRAKILERLHKAGYTDFIELHNMLTKLKKQGLLNIEI